jgi:hypothetical protein
MVSGKGNKCPACGEQKFKTKKAVRLCSGCGVVGWLDKPGGTGGGKGATCQACGESTLHTIYSKGRFLIRWCSSCQAVAITP